MTKLKYDINDRDQPFNLPLKKKKKARSHVLGKNQKQKQK